MTGPIVVAVVFYGLAMLTVLAICADSKRREQEQRPRVTVLGSDNPVADALADALEAHMDAGRQLFDVIGYTVSRHPCGAHVVELVLASDAVTAAERIAREGA